MGPRGIQDWHKHKISYINSGCYSIPFPSGHESCIRFRVSSAQLPLQTRTFHSSLPSFPSLPYLLYLTSLTSFPSKLYLPLLHFPSLSTSLRPFLSYLPSLSCFLPSPPHRLSLSSYPTFSPCFFLLPTHLLPCVISPSPLSSSFLTLPNCTLLPYSSSSLPFPSSFPPPLHPGTCKRIKSNFYKNTEAYYLLVALPFFHLC